MKRKKLYSILLLSILALQGCAENPDKDIIVNKNEGTLQKAIEESNEQDGGKKEQKAETQQHYKEEYAVNSGDMDVIADAEVSAIEGKLPVVRVKPQDITAEMAKKWAEVLFEGQPAYEPGQKTKSDIEEEILFYKQRMEDEEKLEQEAGNAQGIEGIKAVYEEMIQSLQAEYDAAPEELQRKECQWEFHSYDYYNEMLMGTGDTKDLKKTSQLVAETYGLHGGTAQITATNRNEEDYTIHTLWFNYLDENILKNLPYKEVSEEETVSQADTILRDLGLEQWQLANVQEHSDETSSSYFLSYTPVYGGIQTFMSQDIDLKSEDLYAANYYYSQLNVTFYNGIVSSVELISPMEVVKTESEDVNTLTFDEITENFKNYAQANFSKASFVDMANPHIAKAKAELHINQVTQGLFRIKEKGNQDEFLMVPVWKFSGSVLVDGDNWLDTDFGLVNAVDGSIINENLGY